MTGTADSRRTARPEQSVTSALRSAARVRDVLGLAVVPAVLVGVYLLPVGLREELRFAYRDPTLLTAFAANFVHFDVGHLLANVLGFVLLAGTGYVLASLADARLLFGAGTLTNLTVMPVALSALNLAVPRDAVAYGFSGINMAFLGLLGVVLPLYAASSLDPRLTIRHAPLSFLVVVGVSVPLTVPASFARLGLTVAIALGALGYALTLPLDRQFLARLFGRDHWSDLFVVAGLLLVGYPFVGFPGLGASAPARGRLNLYVHLLGFALAFIVAYVASETLAVAADDSGADGVVDTGADGVESAE